MLAGICKSNYGTG